jgi:thioredoxin reductase (NADPH)
MQQRAKANPKIEFVWNSEVKEILGDGSIVHGVRLFNNKTNSESNLAISGFFLGIGHSPVTQIFAGQLELDAENYIKVSEDTKTNVAGVFVAGDVKDFKYRQAITAAGMGCMAALDCEKWLEANS